MGLLFNAYKTRTDSCSNTLTKMDRLFVKNIMTKNPFTVSPDDSVIRAAQIMSGHNFNGLPVLDRENKVVGIITEYDLISKGDSLHLPTLMSLFGNIDIYKNDSGPIKNNLKKLLTIKVLDVMNSDPLTVRDEAPIEILPQMFAEHHKVNPIPVIDRDQRLVGVVSRFDLVRFFANKSSLEVGDYEKPEETDRKVAEFVDDFEKRFVLVSKGRARFWPIVSVLFAIVGFVIAFAIIIRITLNN